MLYLSHSLVIGPLFLQLILPIALSYCGVDMALCKWVEYPHVKKMHAAYLYPKNSPLLCRGGLRSVFTVGCSVSEAFFCHRLKTWFFLDSVAYLTHEISGDISDFIMPN